MKQFIGVVFALFLIPILIFGEQSYQPTEQNLKARQWFQYMFTGVPKLPQNLELSRFKVPNLKGV